METITIDGVDEHAFRHSVEDMLRFDEVDDALAQLRALVEPYAGPGRVLPARFLEVTPADLEITGWDKLAMRLPSYDRPHFPITAIGVVLADARVLGGPGPKDGRLAPYIKTYYFSDDAYPFTNAGREDLLDGYSRDGFGWQGDYQASDVTISIKGIDDLHGAIIALEDRLLDRVNPNEEELRAGSIGACYIAALIHAALRSAVRKQALPRPLCVLAACDGVYPFFDAPVAGWDECGTDAVPADAWPNELDDGTLRDGDELTGGTGHGEASLLDIRGHREAKHLALAICEEDAVAAARFTEEASAQRLVMTDDSALKGLFHGVPVAALDETEWSGEESDDDNPDAGHPAEPLAVLADLADLAEPALAEVIPLEEPPAFPDAREQFRLAEASHAFPTGRGLRQKLIAPQPVGPPPLSVRLKSAASEVEAMLRTRTARITLRARRTRLSLQLRLAGQWTTLRLALAERWANLPRTLLSGRREHAGAQDTAEIVAMPQVEESDRDLELDAGGLVDGEDRRIAIGH